MTHNVKFKASNQTNHAWLVSFWRKSSHILRDKGPVNTAVKIVKVSSLVIGGVLVVHSRCNNPYYLLTGASLLILSFAASKAPAYIARVRNFTLAMKDLAVQAQVRSDLERVGHYHQYPTIDNDRLSEIRPKPRESSDESGGVDESPYPSSTSSVGLEGTW